MRTEISLVFPNQLFEESIIHDLKLDTYVIEENLFFKHFNFFSGFTSLHSKFSSFLHDEATIVFNRISFPSVSNSLNSALLHWGDNCVR